MKTGLSRFRLLPWLLVLFLAVGVAWVGLATDEGAIAIAEKNCTEQPIQICPDCPAPSMCDYSGYEAQIDEEQESNRWLMEELTRQTSFDDYETMSEEFWHYQEYQSNYLYTGKVSANMTAKARELRGDSIEDTVDNVYDFAQYIDYTKYDGARGDETVLKDFRGDCTDASSLAVRLLRLNGIQARQVHGYAGEDRDKHDWMEVLYPDKRSGILYWRPIDWFEYGDLEKVGDDIW
jgi:hypothetical protein